MADITDPATRSRMMSAIRSRDTQPEMAVRSALHGQGLRFRLHRKDLPGRPDLVFPKHCAVVFVHGCFWHLHGCSASKVPTTRPDFWHSKLRGNAARDSAKVSQLLEKGWRVAIVWECSIRRSQRTEDEALYMRLSRWITNGRAKTLVL
jgi:DNA mismatch endonuclease (patch repair protein)